MKHLFSLALAVFLFAGIFACGDSGPQALVVNPDKKASDKILPLDELSPVEADSAMARWEAKRTILKNFLVGIDAPQDTAFVPRGFHIPFADLDSIRSIVGNTSQLFAMLAIEYDANNKPYISLIFQAPDNNKTIRYFDFTLPCPSNCPDKNQLMSR